MTRNNFPVIEGNFIGVDAKPFLNQCRGIVEIGFRQLVRHTIRQHLIYLIGKAQEIQRKSVLAIASPDADRQKKTILETSLTRWRHPCIIVNKDNRLELSLNLFSAPLGCFNTNWWLIVPVEQADIAIDENAYWESLFRPDSEVFPFIEHGNILSFHRLFFGDSPFEVTEWLTHWWNLDTDHGRFLSFFLDPRKDIVWLFDQCIKLICDDPEVWLELISDDRSDPNTHSSGLPGIIQFRVRSPEEIDEMYQTEAVAAPQDIGRDVRVPGWVPAWSWGITGLVRRLVGANIW